MSALETADFPDGWERSPDRGREIAMERRDGRMTVRAIRSALTDGDGNWNLQFEHGVENGYSAARPVGQVRTRKAAVAELVSLAETAEAQLDEGSSPDDVVRAFRN